jgi:hypothetical protein
LFRSRLFGNWFLRSRLCRSRLCRSRFFYGRVLGRRWPRVCRGLLLRRRGLLLWRGLLLRRSLLLGCVRVSRELLLRKLLVVLTRLYG